MAQSTNVLMQDASAPPARVLVRVADVLRDIARGALAALGAGVVVGGAGGRVVMTIAAVINPQATGRRTENGELVGVFSIEGTLALLVFGGLLAGLMGGVVWVVVSPWLPMTGARRALLAMPVAVALGAFGLVQSTNSDFEILAHTELLIAMLLGLVALIGGAVAWLDDQLERRLPRASANPVGTFFAYAALTALGAPIVGLVVTSFLTPGTLTTRPPVGAGIALLVVGAATALWWLSRIATGRLDRPRVLTLAGRAGLAAAVTLGLGYLAVDLGRILAG